MKLNGFSLIEMLVALAIVLIVFSMAAPAFQQQLNLAKLSRALDAVNSQFTRAQLFAMQSHQPVHVSLNHTAKWCFHVSLKPCDCQSPNTCISVSDIPITDYQEHNQVKVIKSTFNPTEFTRFSPSTGLSTGHAGTLTLQAGTLLGKVILSNMGRTRICLVNQQYGHIEQC